MTGGTRLSERERGKGAGWAGPGWSGPAGFPDVAQVGSWPLSFIFSFCFLFPFVLISVLSFEKALPFRFK
jgi:hypothetical protein